jgi:ParB/RepB/Spo0J family partition protein
VKNRKVNTQKPQNICVQSVKLAGICNNSLRLDYYCQSHIEELSNSIERDGLLEPLTVHKSISTGCLTLLNGHYRLKALRRLKQKDAMCRIIESDEKSAVEYYCATFFVKNTLTALEEGHVILQLISQGYNLESISTICGKSPSWACRRVKLVKQLNEEVKENLIRGTIHARTAQEIARLPQGNEQKRVLEIVTKNHLTKEETTKLVEQWNSADETKRSEIEKSFMSDLSKDTKMFLSTPENTLKNAILQCKKTVLNLISFATQMKELKSVWPWVDYDDLCNSMYKLLKITQSEVVKSEIFKSDKGDESL